MIGRVLVRCVMKIKSGLSGLSLTMVQAMLLLPLVMLLGYFGITGYRLNTVVTGDTTVASKSVLVQGGIAMSGPADGEYFWILY